MVIVRCEGKDLAKTSLPSRSVIILYYLHMTNSYITNYIDNSGSSALEYVYGYLIVMEEVSMKRTSIPLFVCVLISVFLVLSGCASKENQRKKELEKMILESNESLNNKDIEKYSSYLTDDFLWVNASSPTPISRDDFIAMLQHLVEGENYHFQEQTMIPGNDFAFFDGCSHVAKNPTTGIKYRVFHADIIEFTGLQMKVMMTFGDGALDSVALGLIEPPLPAPPLPGRRAWLDVETKPTKMKLLDAQKESQARWNSHDLTSLATLIDQDARILISPLYDEISREAFIGWMEVMFQAFPDLKVEATRTIDLGDGWAVSEVKMTGTNLGPYLGNPATGKPFSLIAAYLGRYNSNGHMTNLKLYFNSMSIMNDLGLEPVTVAAQM